MATALVVSTSVPTNPEKEKCVTTIPKVLSPESYIKHPLQNKWALWFFKNDKSKTWRANLRLISKFDTVEDFWALYNHIQLSSNLMSGCDYSLFKDGIEPMWEDAQNRRGGRWLITLSKQQRRADLDRFWLETACVQRQIRRPTKSDHRIPVTCRHGHKERLHNQEQVCCLNTGITHHAFFCSVMFP
ncbi:hypothetical protein ABVT39_006738 [Epinephelus coioides]